RHVTRYGREDSSFSFASRREGVPLDLPLGGVRARAAALLALALPGSVYVYQGEELGLWEVEDIPYELRQDPMWHRSGHADPGRSPSPGRRDSSAWSTSPAAPSRGRSTTPFCSPAARSTAGCCHRRPLPGWACLKLGARQWHPPLRSVPSSPPRRRPS